MSVDQCPPEQHLSDFLFGRDDELSADAVGEHVRRCVACQATLNQYSHQHDTILSALKHGGGQPKFDSEPELLRALDQICDWQSSRTAYQVDAAETVVAEHISLGGVRLGQYQLLELLGEGGMGTVYKAEHTRLEMIVAVKVLSDRLINDPQAVARFEREMKAVGSVNHPNIVRATDAGEQLGRHYLAMEFVDGCDLHQVVHTLGRLRINDACEAIRQAALGIEHAHRLGLIHRDLKPSNLMLTRDGQVKILDLGLARLRVPKTGDVGLTNDFQVMGTADYMPPEQALRATEVDHRVDIYSLGCTLYTLLCGWPPFSGPAYDEPLKKLIAHDRDEPTAVIERRPEVPSELSTLIDKTLAKSPIDRLASAAELAESLQPFTEGSDLAAIVARLPETHRSKAATSDVAKHVAMTDTIASAPRSKPLVNKTYRTRLVIAAALLLLGGAFAAALVLHFTDGEGTIVVEIDGDRMAGEIENGELLIKDKRRGNTYRLTISGSSVSRRLKPGEYNIQVVNDATGLSLLATEFKIKRNDKTVVRAYIEGPRGKPDLPADRSVAAWAVRNNALVSVELNGGIRVVEHIDDLPDGDLLIHKIDFAQRCELTDREWTELSSLTHLTDLAFQDPQLTEFTAIRMARLSDLHLLELRFDAVEPNGLQHLSRLAGVATLFLYGARVEDQDVEAVSQLTRVAWLGLRSPRITDTSLAHIAKMGQLKYLHLLQTPGITDDGIGHLSDLPNLTQFFATRASITDEGVRPLKELKRLEWLNLEGTQISDDGLKQIADMVWLRRLTVTHTRITDAGVANLLPLSKLYHLDLANTQITDAAVDDLATFPEMKDLRVGDRLSAKAVESLRQRLPNCKIISTTSP